MLFSRIISSPRTMSPSQKTGMAQKVSIPLLLFYLTAWYVLNVQYNLYNKKILNAYDFPYTTALIQLGSGLLYIIPKYALGFAKWPSFSSSNISLLSFFHGGGHYATVMSLGAGSVAFANVVKAGEPLCSVLMGFLFNGAIPALMELIALLPIIAGVMIASMAEPEFSMFAFGCAMLSNFLFAARGTYAKICMEKGPKMSGADLFAMNTIFAFVLMAPITFVMEGQSAITGFEQLTTGKAPLDYMALINGELDVKKGKPSPSYFIAYQLVCGLYYYFYNEMAFMVLDLLDPVGQAVGNTVKRVVIIVAGTIVFNKPLTTNGIIGSSVAIGGVLLYSLVKSGALSSKKKQS
ncbi:hypothetical protein GUITHDRAFT_111637 [Guillardia theta CCMP2712]|uniref:Sugar phosphate transporter domain-containing protein n=1 Tax=Guillardia theta (strain CCMP2712) TaxID=905079 RepID=L1J1I2_GUITC|nr:hypothetical protein GUITHDRAFT_111637 [Guillardia theta CCMP2712]EKX42361.1 hypothetical protein GUITHDRAFT_111637 [Guillardia theta CCMP2712]|eukprot:XP_005829341.1 hypothetical protein GUITHDRAFT_111637 [Guillardia theta CCMP2712]